VDTRILRGDERRKLIYRNTACHESLDNTAGTAPDLSPPADRATLGRLASGDLQ